MTNVEARDPRKEPVRANNAARQVGRDEDLGDDKDLFPNHVYQSVVLSGLTLHERKKPTDPRPPMAQVLMPSEIQEEKLEDIRVLVEQGGHLTNVGGVTVPLDNNKEEKPSDKTKEKKKAKKKSSQATQSTFW